MPLGFDLRIIKLGGSLFDLPDLAGELRRWLAQQPPAANVLLAGGGRPADAVREFDRLHGLGDLDAHWLAIRAMELNARLLTSLLKADWLDSLDQGAERAPARANTNLKRKRENAALPPLAILNSYRFMREDERTVNLLPPSWRVTSDSIAARAAEHGGARELVLLKSALPPLPATIEAAVADGYVDPMFPEASRRVPRIRCVNLRQPTFPEVTWRGQMLEQGAKNE
jgi:aspartokinase-like uncharacterized kinase